jgi:hypothetical protein
MRNAFLAATVLLLTLAGIFGCTSGPRVTKIQDVADSAEGAYENILVIALFESGDARRYLEKEVVDELSARGVKAVSMISQTGSLTPVNRQSVTEVVATTGSDAVLVTQVINLESSGELKDRRPTASRNIRPTYYYNVYSYELTEYVEPPQLVYTHSLALATDLFSTASEERVWAIATEQDIKETMEYYRDYSKFVDEAKAIAGALAKDGLLP